ncbi:hypothetical protein KAFR_0C05660 [Kazachstania africana CBS 2517]|uniref:Man1/Src1 C-terminal domain-containing protein n=1 Tax=Kazachstania africana (strain ATCC 22294 / BCRC 22015 / CBS 2517 / CECT 1963 / NBRC 1671 / NRRL Y-8276) TaxID=1071382 RepID=H2AT57_KAZAF|nr:hypothetical protein KAFR_0C05660 [Kazachstania africana CBS 2517]CCF57557.1 hypothetical protein KAFR_0C05660 [Kazachstania africana CBS 2517]
MDLDYLNPDFDTSTLKVTDLRRILTENSIDYSSHSKKSQLLELYKENIVPLIPELREKHLNVKPSSNGIKGITPDNTIKKKRKRESLENESAINPETNSTGRKLNEEFLKDASTPLNKKSKKDSKSMTPIIDKVSKKSPSKSPERALMIDKFELSSSSSDSDLADSIVQFTESKLFESQQRTSSTPSKNNLDFSYKGNEASPSFNNLKVSPAFAKQLHRALEENKNTTEATEEGKSNYSPLLSDESSITDFIPSSSKIPNVPSLNEQLSPAYDFSKPERGEPLVEITDVDNDMDDNLQIGRIKTPELPDEDDVKESENRVKQMQNQIDNHDENSSAESGSFTNPKKDLAQKAKESNLPKLQKTPVIRSKDVILTEQHIKQGLEPILSRSRKEEEKYDVKHILDDNIEIKEDDELEVISDDDEQTAAINGHEDTKPRTFARFIRTCFFNSLALSFIMVPILLGLWYREQKLLVGYCGHELPTSKFETLYPHFPLASTLDNILVPLLPECIPCPENSICYPHMKLKCKPDHKLVRSKFNLFGLIPISHKCERDDKRDQLVKEVVEKSLEFLRIKNAQIMCGESNNDLESGLSEDELYEIFNESRAPWIEAEEFSELWDEVVQILKEKPEITWRQVSNDDLFFIKSNKNEITNKSKQLFDDNPDFSNDTDKHIQAHEIQGQEGYISQTRTKSKNGHFRSSSKKYISLKCKFESEVYRTYYNFRYLIWALVATLSFIKIIEVSLKKYFKEKKETVQLAKKTIERLKKAKKQNADPAYLSTVQLRDIFLSDLVDLKYKNYLWEKALKELRSNTNIKTNLVEIHGEVMKCLEWIGPLEDDENITNGND